MLAPEAICTSPANQLSLTDASAIQCHNKAPSRAPNGLLVGAGSCRRKQDKLPPRSLRFQRVGFFFFFLEKFDVEVVVEVGDTACSGVG